MVDSSTQAGSSAIIVNALGPHAALRDPHGGSIGEEGVPIAAHRGVVGGKLEAAPIEAAPCGGAFELGVSPLSVLLDVLGGDAPGALDEDGLEGVLRDAAVAAVPAGVDLVVAVPVRWVLPVGVDVVLVEERRDLVAGLEGRSREAVLAVEDDVALDDVDVEDAGEGQVPKPDVVCREHEALEPRGRAAFVDGREADERGPDDLDFVAEEAREGLGPVGLGGEVGGDEGPLDGAVEEQEELGLGQDVGRVHREPREGDVVVPEVHPDVLLPPQERRPPSAVSLRDGPLVEELIGAVRDEREPQGVDDLLAGGARAAADGVDELHGLLPHRSVAVPQEELQVPELRFVLLEVRVGDERHGHQGVRGDHRLLLLGRMPRGGVPGGPDEYERQQRRGSQPKHQLRNVRHARRGRDREAPEAKPAARAAPLVAPHAPPKAIVPRGAWSGARRSSTVDRRLVQVTQLGALSRAADTIPLGCAHPERGFGHASPSAVACSRDGTVGRFALLRLRQRPQDGLWLDAATLAPSPIAFRTQATAGGFGCTYLR